MLAEEGRLAAVGTTGYCGMDTVGARRNGGLIAGFAVLVCFGGCDDSGYDPLAGRQFLSETIVGYELLEGTRVSLWFRDGEVGAGGGCNASYGAYEVSGGRLVVDYLGSTEKACSPEKLHEQDEWLAAFLMSDPALTVEEPRITLAGDPYVVTLLDREVAKPDLPLVGTDWRLQFFIRGELAGGPGAWPTTVLRFADDGTFGIEAGCPTAQGRYAVEGETVVLSEVVLGLDACPADAAEVEVVTAVLSDGTDEVELDSNRLVLMRGDLGLAFEG